MRSSAARSWSARPPPPSSTRATHTLTLAPQLGTAPADDTPYLVENELLGAVHVLTASTPATLQDALAIAQASLGNSSTIDFGLVDNGGAKLRLDLTWERKYGVSQPVSLEIGDQELGGASAGGELSLEASGTVKLRLPPPAHRGGHAQPGRQHPGRQVGVRDRLRRQGRRRRRAHRRQHRPGQRRPRQGSAASSAASTQASGSRSPAPPAEDTPTITDFFTGGFGVTRHQRRIDATGDVVICADFPVFVSNVQPPGDNLKITSTLGGGREPDEGLLDTGTKVELPSGLQKILDGEAFKFDSLAEGLQQYLFYSETALRTASNDGEMPVVGKDLQAGADFMGKAREKLDAMLAVADPTTVGGATTMLKAKLAEMGVVVDGYDRHRRQLHLHLARYHRPHRRRRRRRADHAARPLTRPSTSTRSCPPTRTPRLSSTTRSPPTPPSPRRPTPRPCRPRSSTRSPGPRSTSPPATRCSAR